MATYKQFCEWRARHDGSLFDLHYHVDSVHPELAQMQDIRFERRELKKKNLHADAYSEFMSIVCDRVVAELRDVLSTPGLRNYHITFSSDLRCCQDRIGLVLDYEEFSKKPEALRNKGVVITYRTIGRHTMFAKINQYRI